MYRKLCLQHELRTKLCEIRYCSEVKSESQKSQIRCVTSLCTATERNVRSLQDYSQRNLITFLNSRALPNTALLTGQPKLNIFLFTTGMMYLYHHFKDYSSLMFPNRHTFAKAKLSLFCHFKNIRCIVDCTEFFCKMPEDYGRQGNFYSSYKHHCTMKCRIVVSPSGGTCFISDLYEGSANDVQIFSECGILKHINPGDAAMVDKGFSVQELLLTLQATTFIPPFLRNHKIFTKEEVILLKRIAKARIHLERFNERLKKLCLFDQVIPLSLAPLPLS